MKRLRTIAPVCLALVVLIAVSAQAQVLQQVPTDALVVIKFKNIKAVSDKLALLANKFGIAQSVPQAQDPLAAFKESINAKTGLKDDGDAAVAIVSLSKDISQPPAFVVLLPVTDYQTFLGNYPDAKTESGISTIKFPNKPNEPPGYVAQWGDYAALSDNRDLLTQKPAGITPTGLAAKQLQSKDITLYANMAAIRAVALPKLQKSRQEMKDKLQAKIDKNPQFAAKYGHLTGALADELTGIAEQFLQQTQAATLGVELTEQSILPTGVIEFDPHASWGQTISTVKNTDQPLILGLPELKYLFVSGLSVDSDAAVKLIDDATAPLQSDLAKLGDTGKAITDYIDAFRSLLKATKSEAGGMIAPSGMIGQGSLIQIVSVLNGNAPQILDSVKVLVEKQQAFVQLMGKQAQTQTTYTQNAKTVDGVQLNELAVRALPPGPNATMQQRQMQQIMSMMYGPNGQVTYDGSVSPDKVVSASGVSDEVISKLIASAKSDNAKVAQTQPVQQVANQLPKQRVFVMYVHLDNLASTLMTYARNFGMPINVQVPENLQPIGVTAGTEGSAIRVDGVVPADTIQALISAGMQAYMNMQQGGQGAAGPGAGAP